MIFLNTISTQIHIIKSTNPLGPPCRQNHFVPVNFCFHLFVRTENTPKLCLGWAGYPFVFSGVVALESFGWKGRLGVRHLRPRPAAMNHWGGGSYHSSSSLPVLECSGTTCKCFYPLQHNFFGCRGCLLFCWHTDK